MGPRRLTPAPHERRMDSDAPDDGSRALEGPGPDDMNDDTKQSWVDETTLSSWLSGALDDAADDEAPRRAEPDDERGR